MCCRPIGAGCGKIYCQVKIDTYNERPKTKMWFYPDRYELRTERFIRLPRTNRAARERPILCRGRVYAL